jgi:uncharacterized protein YeaO (DUF488 family)
MKWIQIKRVYEKPLQKDGFRVLVDRLWPRGISKETAAVDEWIKDLAPTNELRKWFGHDPERWAGFQSKYKAELKKNEAVDLFIKNYKKKKAITLVYSAKDEWHNQALVLQEYLEARHTA